MIPPALALALSTCLLAQSATAPALPPRGSVTVFPTQRSRATELGASVSAAFTANAANNAESGGGPVAQAWVRFDAGAGQLEFKASPTLLTTSYRLDLARRFSLLGHLGTGVEYGRSSGDRAVTVISAAPALTALLILGDDDRYWAAMRLGYVHQTRFISYPGGAESTTTSNSAHSMVAAIGMRFNTAPGLQVAAEIAGGRSESRGGVDTQRAYFVQPSLAFHL